MLDTAKRLLRQILDTLRPEIEAGTPLVGLEPSCVAVFRDELRNLFPMDEDAKRLAGNVFTLAEFLEKKAPGLPRAEAPTQGDGARHCHHTHVMTLRTSSSVLKKHGPRLRDARLGCCGMAGSFGFEADHYDVSVAVGERVLLPGRPRAPRTTR